MNKKCWIKTDLDNSSIESYNNEIVCHTLDGVPITRSQLAYFHRMLREALTIIHA